MQMRNKMIIYQVLPRLFGNLKETLIKNGTVHEDGVGKFSAFTPQALNEIRELGATHIWYTGVIEHATQTDFTSHGIPRDHGAIVKGKAGSPYAIKDYYDIDPDLADDVNKRMAEFEALIARTHEAGLKVIMDFVPNHVARVYHSDARLSYVEDLGQHDNTTVSFAVNNNFYYIPGQPLELHFGAQEEDFEYSEFPAKVTGNNCFSVSPDVNDWYETVKLNYGVDFQNGGACYFDPFPDTWKKMYEILKFWSQKGVDGFRCDMAELVPVEFWKWVIPEIKKDFDICFIAEVYDPFEYRNYIFNGHFDYLYDKVGLYDTIRDVMCGNKPATEITRCWQTVEGIQQRMLNFLENHDEQRIASNFFAGNAESGIPGMMLSALMDINPVMIYNGQELGEKGMDEEGFSGKDGRTTIFDYWSMESVRNWINDGHFDGGKLTGKQKILRETYKKILNIARTELAVTAGVFHDLMYANTTNPSFDTNTQFAFLRKFHNEVLLVVTNFSGEFKRTRVNIPSGAFDAMGFHDNRAAIVTDLLTDEKNVSTLTAAYPYEVDIPPYSGKILKFVYKEI
ncbi:MAG: alpha-amylase family protein [Tannerellaceae bacterium]|nr:alpha-amylase family protein [Tannerellaceae bacterium]